MSDSESFSKKITQIPEKYRRSDYRTLIKKESKLSSEAVRGKVVTSIGRVFFVLPDDSSDKSYSSLFECVAAGTMISGNQCSTMIVVGDNVHFIKGMHNVKNNYPKGKIIKVEERKTSFSRKIAGKELEDVLASNIDNLIVFVSAVNPSYNRRLIDRYLVAAELGCLSPIICINKIDLISDDLLTEDFQTYQKLGIPVHFISALNNINLSEFFYSIRNTNSLLSGPSGVGKSTLINNIFSSDVQKVREISKKTSKGKHTTSATNMFFLQEGGAIIDTPGLREFGLSGIPKQEICLYFHDFDELFPNCKFLHCTHTHEPNCEVRNAYEKGLIDAQRYESYLNIFESIEE